MIGVDTNILVYAHRRESPFQVVAEAAMRSLVEGNRSYLVPMHCFCEFFCIVTNHRIFKEPSTVEQALEHAAFWMSGDHFGLGSDSPNVMVKLIELIVSLRVAGPAIYDTRIAAICLDAGVDEFWSADRDFARFPQLKVVNPLAKS